MCVFVMTRVLATHTPNCESCVFIAHFIAGYIFDTNSSLLHLNSFYFILQFSIAAWNFCCSVNYFSAEARWLPVTSQLKYWHQPEFMNSFDALHHFYAKCTNQTGKRQLRIINLCAVYNELFERAKSRRYTSWFRMKLCIIRILLAASWVHLRVMRQIRPPMGGVVCKHKICLSH